MSEHPSLFGFGGAETKAVDYPMVFTGHYLVGGNPDDEEGYWDTREQAIEGFATQFSKIATVAQHQFLFVRRAPALFQNKEFGGGIKYRMIGRFSIGHIKEKANETTS
jgi:hypothetical protein